jgi:hypothetical protein
MKPNTYSPTTTKHELVRDPLEVESICHNRVYGLPKGEHGEVKTAREELLARLPKWSIEEDAPLYDY